MPPFPPSSSRRRAPSRRRRQRLDLGVARIDARIGGDRVSSAGIVLDADRGLVLASAHPLWGATSLKVTTGLAVLHGRIVARDACDDLALVEVQPRLPGLVAPAPVRRRRPAQRPRRPARAPSRRPADRLLERRARDARRPPRRGRARAARAARACRCAARCRWPDALGARVQRRSAAGARRAPGGDGDRGPLRRPDGGRGLPWSRISALMAQLRSGPRTVYVGWERHYRCAPAQHRRAAAQHPAFRPADARLNAPVPATRLPGTAGVDS